MHTILSSTVNNFVSSLSNDEQSYLLHHTFPEDWDGDDDNIIARLKGILFCAMVCHKHADETGYDLHCEGCNKNPRQ